ncbi:helix-turn-helix transcriptional regulator [Microbulbifer sp. MLAF003]|uniref:helix-turn-helix domain-containing protein n=1 Tax=Microbulbifer sp. MLAF003 TaxID=3032582 RepID=UPI0024ADBFAE|nr:helix-turn-helix transcriptional regulator [Microbulbifer sp. MLAF003]WHI51660.1 helix-turn-helix transcriptional regulator [Microbulbifer sp. MLAF003]
MNRLPTNWLELSPGLRLAQQRRALGLSLVKMAAISGITAERLQRIERGNGRLAPGELLPLLGGYNLSPNSWLVGMEKVPLLGIEASPQFQQHLSLLDLDEMQAVEKFVFNITAGRNAQP